MPWHGLQSSEYHDIHLSYCKLYYHFSKDYEYIHYIWPYSTAIKLEKFDHFYSTKESAENILTKIFKYVLWLGSWMVHTWYIQVVDLIW